MFKKIIYFVFVFFALFYAGSSFAQELIPTGSTSIVLLSSQGTSSSSSVLKVDIAVKIKEGIEMLKKSSSLQYQVKKGTSTLVRKQIALAILNLNTGELVEKRVWVREQDIRNYRYTRSIVLSPENENEVLDIRVKQWNSFNTPYEVAGRPDLIIVANKYLLPNKSLLPPDRNPAKTYSDIVYVPYSELLKTDALVSEGKNYLDAIITEAFGDLEKRNVMSRSLPGQLVTSVVEKEFIKNIILVEHVDPTSFMRSADQGKNLSERVLALLGMNGSFAFRYAMSPAGANGIAQFIRPTYIAIYNQYPDAKLTKDYYLGMADHANAVKAMVLFFDHYKNHINNKITRKDVVAQLGITEEMLAAAYNGGPGKVITAVNRNGFQWASTAGRVFRNETLTYIKKFQSIKGLNIF